MEPKSNPEKTERSEGETERARIERDFTEARQIRGAEGDEQTQACIGDADGKHAANEPENDAFDQQLAGNARAARSERGADGKLVLARLRANKEQVGNVDAGDQHDQADGGHHHPQHA